MTDDVTPSDSTRSLLSNELRSDESLPLVQGSTHLMTSVDRLSEVRLTGLHHLTLSTYPVQQGTVSQLSDVQPTDWAFQAL